MRATGIIRKTDDLGRIVIPKEIRRVMKLETGVPMEIYVTKDGQGVCFKKYNPIEDAEWDKVVRVVNAILPFDFTLLNNFSIGDLTHPPEQNAHVDINCGSVECELWVEGKHLNDPAIDVVIDVVEAMLTEDE